MLLASSLFTLFAAVSGSQADPEAVRDAGREAARLLVELDADKRSTSQTATALTRLDHAAEVVFLLRYHGRVPRAWETDADAAFYGESSRAALREAWSHVALADVRAILGGILEDSGRAPQRRRAVELLGEVGQGQDLRLLLRLAEPYSAQVHVTVRDRRIVQQALRAILARDADGLSSSRSLFAEAHDALLSSIIAAVEAEPDPQRLEVLASLLDVVPELNVTILAAIQRMAREVEHPVDVYVKRSVRSFLMREDSGLLQMSVRASASLEDYDACSGMIELFEHHDPNVRAAARFALVELTGLDFHTAKVWRNWFDAEQAWWDTSSHEVFGALETAEPVEVARLLSSLTGRRLHRHQLAQAIVGCLHRSEAELAVIACGALQQLGSRTVVPDLLDYLENNSGSQRVAAWRALVSLTGLDLPPDPAAWRQALT